MTERQPAGQPTGGQFAPTSGSDAGLDLGEPERPTHAPGPFLNALNDFPGGAGVDRAFDKIADIHQRNSGGYCGAGREETCGAGQAVCDVYQSILSLDTMKPQGTMKSWMRQHEGRKVHTVQVSMSGMNYSVWAPRDRTVAMRGAGGVTMAADGADPSLREFAGMRVVVADEHTLVVASEREFILYSAAGSADARENDAAQD